MSGPKFVDGLLYLTDDFDADVNDSSLDITSAELVIFRFAYEAALSRGKSKDEAVSFALLELRKLRFDSDLINGLGDSD